MPEIAFDILLMVDEMEHSKLDDNAEEPGFKLPTLPVNPVLRRQTSQRRTMEWLNMDVDYSDSDTLSFYSEGLNQIQDVDVDFKELHKRTQSTSTPFIPRTIAFTSPHSDSGIDSSLLNMQSGIMTTSVCCSTANDSLLSHTSDCQPSKRTGKGRASLEAYVSSKCSETDSAFGDASVSLHDTTHDSQVSDTFSVDLHQDLHIQKTLSSDISSSEGNLSEPSPVCKHDSGFASASNSSSSRSFGSSSSDLLLPPPSWCSPFPTLPTLAKPSCASTPKDTLQESMKNVLRHFSPGEPDRLIGRKMGLDRVDIVSELSNRSIPSVKLVLAYLKPEDLCRSCMVSRQWRSAIYNDSAASKRRKGFLRSQKCQKENTAGRSKKSHLQRGMTGGGVHLGTIQAVAKKKVHSSEEVVSLATTRHQTFWEAAKKCKQGESIRKCPRCSGPAHVHDVQERAWCSNEKCAFDFCIRCSLPFHGAKDCSLQVTKNSKKKKSENVVGSKKSKKMLRRL